MSSAWLMWAESRQMRVHAYDAEAELEWARCGRRTNGRTVRVFAPSTAAIAAGVACHRCVELDRREDQQQRIRGEAA